MVKDGCAGTGRGVVAVAALLVVGLAAGTPTAHAELTPAKRRLVRQLLELSGSNEMAAAMSGGVLADIKRTYEPMMEMAVSQQEDLTDAQRAQLAERLADFDAFAAKFEARFGEKLKMSDLILSVYEPIYDENFSEAELQQMVAFYETPVGQKAISRMPRIMEQAWAGTYALIQPRVVDLIQEIVAEERAAVEE